jgi:adenine-specific DNA methylase
MKILLDILDSKSYILYVKFLESKKVEVIKMKVNGLIRNYIKQNGMSFSFVADRSGFNIKKFSRFMSNKQPMTTDEYEKVCKEGLRVDPAYFYKNVS